jgi:hypothetical protein
MDEAEAMAALRRATLGLPANWTQNGPVGRKKPLRRPRGVEKSFGKQIFSIAKA